MSQTGYSKVQIYSSSTASNTPSASNLTNDTNGSELAINITDGKLFYKNNSGSVQLLANSSSQVPTPFTANGVVYASSTSALATGSGLQFDGTNLGLGVTPSAWSTSGYPALQLKSGGSFWSTSANGTVYSQNTYFNGTNQIYLTTNPATYYQQYNGTHIWQYALSGTAGNTASFTQAMTLDNSGNLILAGTTASSWTSNGSLTLGGSGGSYGVTIYNGTNTGGLYFASSLSGGGRHAGSITYNGTSNAMLFETNANGTVATLDTNGNLGLGVTPTARLDVLSTYSSDTASQQRFRDNTGVSLNFGGTGSGSKFLQAQDSGGASTYYNILLNPYGGSLLVGATSVSSTALNNGGCVVAPNYMQISVGASSGTAMYFYTKGGSAVVGAGSITVSGSTALFVGTSDERLKTDNGLTQTSRIKDVKIHNFTWKTDNTNSIGVFAQELYAVIPEAVKVGSDEVDENGNFKEFWGVDYSKLMPDLIVEIQQLRTLVTALQAKVGI